jgi:tripartite-type tricarboxylate transporter receptor subunit TctC
VTDLLGGNVQVMLIGMSTVMPFVRAGRHIPLGVSSLKPSPLMPEIPTIASAGLPGFEVSDWFGVFVPARTPSAIVVKLNGEINAMMQLPEAKQRMSKETFDSVPGNTPAQFSAFVQAELVKWAKVIKDAGIVLN